MGLFISLEGPDGSGKSTQARRLEEWLRRQGHVVVATREPGGTPLGDRLRELILDPASPPATPLAMALMLAASRAQLVDQVLRPALERGETVLVDRYIDSTVAYQAAGLGVSRESIRAINEIATGGLKPDVTIYIDIAPEIGLARIRDRGRENRLDAETLAFHHAVRDGYQNLIAEEPARWRRVDGNRPPDAVQAAILEAIRPMLERGVPSA